MRWLAALLLLTACAEQRISTYPATGLWRLVELDGAPAPATTTLRFPKRGRVEGTLPCNRYTAQQTAAYPWFILSHFEVEAGSCEATALEERIVHTLASVTRAEVRGGTLILSSQDGQELVFRRD